MSTWKEKRDLLVELIKKVSDINGGDDPLWLADYQREIVNRYRDDLDSALDCFRSLMGRKDYEQMEKKRGVTTNRLY